MDLSFVREIQLQQLDVLKKVIELFEQENIRYFAIGGTALGAIRHGGFIPWDDDIDLALLRPDYEKFLKLQNKLPNNLLLYNFETSQNYPLFFSKIYDIEKPYFCYSDRKYAVPRNIFIDIFPWDNFTAPAMLKHKLEKTNLKFRRLIYKHNGNLIDKLKFFMYKLFYKLQSSSGLYKKYHAIIKQHENTSSKTWGNVLFNDVLEYEDIFPLRPISFEGLEIFVPRKCEKYLELKYGDYMTLPPEDQRTNHSRL